jgi:hypothetical protein
MSGSIHAAGDSVVFACVPGISTGLVDSASGLSIIVAASNNFGKGIYAYAMADRKTGLRLLLGLAAPCLAPLFWLPA